MLVNILASDRLNKQLIRFELFMTEIDRHGNEKHGEHPSCISAAAEAALYSCVFATFPSQIVIKWVWMSLIS